MPVAGNACGKEGEGGEGGCDRWADLHTGLKYSKTWERGYIFPCKGAFTDRFAHA